MIHWHFLAFAGTTLTCVTVIVACLRPEPHRGRRTTAAGGSNSVLDSYFDNKRCTRGKPAPQPGQSPREVRRAHRMMQIHRECRVGSCPEKSVAFATLVAAGHLVPDSSRTRG